MLRLNSRQLHLWTLAAAVSLAMAASVALGQEADLSEIPTDDATEEQGSWLDRTLKRYFGGRSQEGEDLAGGADQIVDRYLEHLGKTIEVVIVHQVNEFEEGWDSDQDVSTRLLNRLTGKVQSYTRDGLIRQYLLFHRGDRVDPFLLADSERMLRDLEFINDVRIVIVPLGGEPDSVAVVVETRDRWPFGVAGTVKDVDWFEGSLFLSNLGGQGIRFDNKFLYRRDFRPELGYRGTLSKGNVAGTFVDASLEFEDSWRELRRYASLDRDLVHPGIKWLGGVAGEDTDDRDNEGEPRRFKQLDSWVGRNVRLGERPADQGAGRKALVPALRVLGRRWIDRPTVLPDSNLEYHGMRRYMAGVTYRRISNYRTSYLYRMGEVENLPSGIVLKWTGGYEDGEFTDRTFSFFESAILSVRPRGDVFSGKLAFGGFLRDQRLEEGLVDLEVIYNTRLFGKGPFRNRCYSRIRFTHGLERVNPDRLMLGNRTGLRELEDNAVFGDQRLLGNFESRLFTPWHVMGFHLMIFGFLDAGTVVGEDDGLFRGKIYASGGLGIRLNNPDLVLETVQVRVAFLNNIYDRGLAVAFDVGNPNYPTLSMPGVRPATFGYQ